MRLLINTPTEDAEAWRAQFLALAPELDIRIWPDAGPVEEIDVVFAWRTRAGDLARYPRLRAVFSLGAGVDGLLADPQFPRHVPLVRMVDPNLAVLMAEYVAAAVLRYHCELDRYQALQAGQRWEKHVRPFACERTVGVLGLGELGTNAARTLAALGFPVRGWARSAHAIDGVHTFAGEAGLPAFLDALQVLVCLLPLTPHTRGLLDARLFARLAPGAFVINVARGAHVVERDLLAALDSGQLAGATLDVFDTEPLPAGHPYWTHPRVLVTPHISSVTSLRTAAALVVDNLRQWQAGGRLRNVVDPERGY